MKNNRISVTSVERSVVIYDVCFLVRLAHLVQLDPSVQTLQPRPLNAQMGLTAWVLQPLAQNAQLDITVVPPGKMQCHCHVMLVSTATYQPLSALPVKLAMPVKDLTRLRDHHQGYVHWVSIALMVCKRQPAQLVHMVTSLVHQVKLQDVHLVLLVITAQQGPEVILPTGLCKELLVLL